MRHPGRPRQAPQHDGFCGSLVWACWRRSCRPEVISHTTRWLLRIVVGQSTTNNRNICIMRHPCFQGRSKHEPTGRCRQAGGDAIAWDDKPRDTMASADRRGASHTTRWLLRIVVGQYNEAPGLSRQADPHMGRHAGGVAIDRSDKPRDFTAGRGVVHVHETPQGTQDRPTQVPLRAGVGRLAA